MFLKKLLNLRGSWCIMETNILFGSGKMYKFSKNAVVCFLGDSITARGRWICRVLDYYRQVQPECTLKTFNCGRSGGNATVAIKRMETDLFPYKPTDVVIMFGMNDVCHELYACEQVTEEVLKERVRVMEEYEESMTTIAKTLSAMGANLIFCTPTPTDVDQINEAPYRPGGKLALQWASRIVKKLAENYGGHIVDFQTEFSYMIDVLRKENLHNNIISGDRTHPTECGEEVMAKLFLRAQGFDVPLYDKMADWEAESKKPFSEHTQPIYDISMTLRALAFVEWGLLRDVPDDKIEEELDKWYNGPDSNDFYRSRIDMYRENIGKKDEYIKELISIS